MSELKTVKRLLPCDLTDDEVAVRAQELAQAEMYRGQVLSDFSAATEDWKEQKKRSAANLERAERAEVKLAKVVEAAETATNGLIADAVEIRGSWADFDGRDNLRSVHEWLDPLRAALAAAREPTNPADDPTIPLERISPDAAAKEKP